MNMKRIRTNQDGSIILEALISILIFSIGILALVGMQAAAINNVADSKYRSTAGFLANQMVGTIWSASSAIVNTASNNLQTTPNASFACNPCGSSSGVGNSYTQAWMANSVISALPDSSDKTLIQISGPMVTVTVGWKAPNEATAHRHVVQTFIN